MRIGIDLLWVRVGKCGGTESYIRNLLDGFGRYDRDNEYLLLAAKDNASSFETYDQYDNMRRQILPVGSASQPRRILWENLYLDRTARKLGIDVMFIPVYSMPMTYGSGIPYVCVIHDLQAFHYPQYFSAIRRLFLKYMWKHACKAAAQVVVISEYGKRDLESHYPMAASRCSVIYDPVVTGTSDMPFDTLREKYGIQADHYFYCVSSMLPHKNLETLLEVMMLRKQEGNTIPLVLSGVGGEKAAFNEAAAKRGIQDLVIDTGFVSDEERDCLYENCRLFLFPSVFEGFGLPPIEAMRRGKRVVMTRCSCLEEITQGKAVYVEDPYDPEQWREQIEAAQDMPEQREAFPEYEPESVVQQYKRMWQTAGRTVAGQDEERR